MRKREINEAAKGVLYQIDLVKKAILTHAFRGELGTNDLSEENAKELMKKAVEREN